MANSYNIYVGDGATQTFAVPFPYLSKVHVTVRVADVVTAFTWDSDAVVRVSPAPANLAQVEVRRNTPIGPIVNFQTANPLLANDLNGSELQALYLAAEAKDDVVQAAIGIVPALDAATLGGNPPSVFEKVINKAAANGYAGLDGNAKVPDNQLNSIIQRVNSPVNKGTVAGTSSAYTLTLPNVPSGVVPDGTEVVLIPGLNNTGATTTLDIGDGAGPLKIYRGQLWLLAPGDLQANVPAKLIKSNGAYYLMNPCGGDSTPASTRHFFGPSTQVPTGFILPTGQTLSIRDYEELFTKLVGAASVLGLPAAVASFTVNAATDVITQASHPFLNDDPWMATDSGGTLAAPLTVNTKYYVVNVTASTYQLSLTKGGSVLDLTTAGTGTQSSYNTFKVPDLRGITPVGLDNMGGSSRNQVTAAWASTLGTQGGEEKHVLTVAELASHAHNLHITDNLGAGAPASWTYGGAGVAGNDRVNVGSSVEANGSGSSHNTMQPGVSCNILMRC